MGVTLEIFKISGTIPVSIDLLNIKVKTGVISAAIIFIKLLGTPREDFLLSKETN
jgi:hypothetical protein